MLAAAFGLTIGINDTILQSYLFTEAPGLVSLKVRDLQDAYQELIITNKQKISSAAGAYNTLQNYYNLCLPQTIEGTMLQTVVKASVATSNPGDDASGAKPKAKGATGDKKPTGTSINSKIELVAEPKK